MAATSVTGRGLGMSNGLQKKANHCSCACSCKGDACEQQMPTPRKRGCVTNYNNPSGTSYKTGGTASTKVC